MSGEMKTKPAAARVSRIVEAPAALERRGTQVERSIDGQRGQSGPQGGGELLADDGGRPFDVDLDARAGVLDPAVETEPAGQAVDVGPEADALDDAEHREAGGRPAGAGRHAGRRLTMTALLRAASRL